MDLLLETDSVPFDYYDTHLFLLLASCRMSEG